jgi:hypothetical protein
MKAGRLITVGLLALLGVPVTVLIIVAAKIEGKRWLHHLNGKYGNPGWAAGMLMVLIVILMALTMIFSDQEKA